MDDAHCGLPLEELVPLAETLLEIPAETVEAARSLGQPVRGRGAGSTAISGGPPPRLALT
jgi:hypothetical protein